MTNDAMDSLADLVPGSIAGGVVARRAASPGRPTDRRIGKRGADLLAGVPLFMGLSRRHLRQLAEMADEVSFHAGERVVEAGHPGEAMFVILQGEARVMRGARAIARLYPGEFFGEISLLDGGPRTATVIAETPMAAIRIYRQALRKLLAGEPVVAIKILEQVARRLREMERPLTG